MTQIKQTLQDLKPDTRYLVVVEAFDNNLGTVAATTNAIIETPADTTVPTGISNIYLYSNSKAVMFKLDAPNDPDLAGYDYQLYSANSLSSTLLQERK